MQSRSAAEATEARKPHEDLTDLVSHEMRVTLSAITQFADRIAGSLDDWVGADHSIKSAAELLEGHYAEWIDDPKLRCSTEANH